MYGYFYINIYKNPNHKIIKNKVLVDYYLNLTKSYIESNYEPDWILYDYMDKPSNHGFKSFLGVNVNLFCRFLVKNFVGFW